MTPSVGAKASTCLVSTLLLAGVIGCGSSSEAKAAIAGKTAPATLRASNKLNLDAQWTIPMIEVSGLSINGDHLIAESDNTSDLLSIPLKRDNSSVVEIAEATKIPLKMHGFRASSQWEALATDATAEIFLLQENQNRIYEFNAAGEQVRSYSLANWSGRTDMSKGYEGMLLLANGHFLLALDSNVTALVEYGPANESAGGLMAGASATLPADEEFRAPGDTSLVPLAAWTMKDMPSGCRFSDLARMPDGNVAILGKACLQIFEVAKLDPAKATFKYTASWSLPSSLPHVEGLQAFGDEGFLVASDLDTQQKNLFLLKFDGK